MKKSPIIIAIDGPAASGKGSLARKLAVHFGFDYLDTGTLYRRIAIKVLETNTNPADHEAVTMLTKQLNPTDQYDDAALRADNVGSTASVIAQIQSVRDVLIEYQRNFARKSSSGAVLDGRDIGTVICPDANVKFFVTASLEERAQRRTKELQSRGIPSKYASVLAEMQERDDRDSTRIDAHLNPDNNIHYMDTSDMTPQSVLDEAIEIIESHRT